MSASVDAQQPVPVTSLGLGAVLVGAEGAAPAGNVGVELEGAVLFVNPCLPGRIPACLISDPAQAEPVISQLYGQEVARLVERMAERPQGDASMATFAPEDDEALPWLTGLGTIRWLEARSPLPLDRRLLRLEELTLVGLCGTYLADEEDPVDELAELCRHYVPILEEEADFASLGALLELALEHVANHAPVTSSHGSWSREALRVLPVRDSRGEGQVAVPWSVLLRPQFALAAGTDQAPETATGTHTVGWDSLPPGWVSTAEDNAHWTLESTPDGVHAWVGIDPAEPVRWFGGSAWELGPGAAELGFHLTCAGTPWLSVSGSLSHDPAVGWEGGTAVDGALGASLRRAVTDGHRIRLRVWRPGVRPQPVSDVDLPSRWSARGVSALRLLAGANEASLVPCVRDVMLEAAAAWDAVGEHQAAEACRAAIRVADSGELPSVRLTLAEQWLLTAP